MTASKAARRGWSLPDLDRPELFAALDPSGMRHRLRSVPRQCRAAWRQIEEWRPSALSGDYDRVIIGGMGGSAIAGSLTADLSAWQQAVPVVVVRGFHLPFALNRRTLFIACSHSGNTRETLSLYHQARAEGADILAITAGGALSRAAAAHGAPTLPVNAPGEPRSAVGYNLILLLGVLRRLRLLNLTADEAADSAAALERQVARLGEAVNHPDNPAKQLAGELAGRLIVVYGGGIFAAVARRWKAQLNENAKVWAFYENLPEALHNSVESYGETSHSGEELIALLLRPNAASRELTDCYRALRQMLQWGGIDHRMLTVPPGPPLTQLLGMLLLGDYVSYYLALLRGLDPSPTPAIERSKGLAGG